MTIIEINYNVPKVGEIDIISRDEGMLVFTDVKTHTAGHSWGDTLSKIDENKGDRIMNAVQHYIRTHELECDFRFDMGKVVLGKRKPEISILKDARSLY